MLCRLMSESRDETKLTGDVFKKLLTPEVVAGIAREMGLPEMMEMLKNKNAPKQLPAGKKTKWPQVPVSDAELSRDDDVEQLKGLAESYHRMSESASMERPR
jgi:hypothetical protein